MTKPDDTIRVLIPLKVRKKNGRPKIMPPADYRHSEDQTQDPHILRAIGRAWGWRRRMEPVSSPRSRNWPTPLGWQNVMSAVSYGWPIWPQMC